MDEERAQCYNSAMASQSPIASTSASPAFDRRSTQPPSLSPTTSMSPVSPKSVRQRPRPRRAYSETSDDSSASREGSPPCTGPWREKRRPSSSIAYDLPRALERSVALSRSRSNSSSDSASASTSPVLAPSPLAASYSPARPALSFKPASPNQAQATFTTAMPASPLALSPGSFASPSSKRQRNKKLLSLNIAIAAPVSGSSSGSSTVAGSRSCPPSPLLVEGSSKDLDEMRANVRGDVRMSRRTSIPRLSAINVAAASDAAVDDEGANPVKLIGRNGEGGMEDEEEQYPYANGPREILPGIYLGSEQNAKDAQCLRSLDISFVLNVAKEVICPWTAEDTIAEEEEESDQHSASKSGASGASSSSRASSPTHSDDSVSPSSATTSATSIDPSHELKLSRSPSSELHRPHVIRSTASTPNLQTSLAAPKSEGWTIQSTSAPGVRTMPVTPPGIRRFPKNTLTGRPALEYLHLPWGHDEDNLVARFPTAFAFVDRARAAHSNVLVHCQCGVSRSATAVIAYVMREAASGQNASLSSITGMHEAYQWVKDRSAWITPNMSLLYQLREWEQALSAAEGTSSPTTPSSLMPALASLDVPFASDGAAPTSDGDEMDTDPPASLFGGSRLPSDRREAHRRTFSTEMIHSSR